MAQFESTHAFIFVKMWLMEFQKTVEELTHYRPKTTETKTTGDGTYKPSY